MKLTDQDFEILDATVSSEWAIEKVARVCYKSEANTGPGTAKSMCKKLIKMDHEAMLEFADVTVKITTDRATSHQLVRHRLCSFAQESQRYVNYKNDDIEFITPANFDTWSYQAKTHFKTSLLVAEKAYKSLIAEGLAPQDARAVLPNATATTIAVKANMRQWRSMFKLRVSKKASPQIRALMDNILTVFKDLWPALYEDISNLDG